MTIEPKDVLTVVAGALSLSGLYYALKRNVDKLNITVTTMDSHHKREVTAIHYRIDEIKTDTKETINKLDGKIDAIQQQNALISANIAELTGYLKAKK